MSTSLLPNWISEDTILKAVQNFKKDKTIEIVELVTKNAVSVGENYTSDMLKVSVLFKSNNHCFKNNVETLNIIVKCEGETKAKEALAKEVHVFKIETKMFTETIPKLHKILGASFLSAEYLLSGSDPLSFIILQDLTPMGYKMAERQKGLNYEHCTVALEKLALLHASSAVLYEKEPHSMEPYFAGLFTNQHENKVIEQFVVTGFQSMANLLNSWPGFEKYAKKLFGQMDGIFKKSMDVGLPKPGQFSVLNHGDFWTNNMMFKYNTNEKPIDCKLVDFQFSVFTSPAVDLQYFISTSPQPEMGRKHLSKLLCHYHEHLAAALRKLNYPNEKIPSYKQIYDDFKDRGFYAIVSMAVALPLIKSSSRIDATYDEFTNEIETEFRRSCFASDAYKESLQTLLPLYDDFGYLD